MKRFVFQLGTLVPCPAAVLRLEKPARFIVTMGRHVERPAIARVDDDVIDEQPRHVEVVQQSPTPGGIAGDVDLSVKRAKIKAVGIVRIDHQGPHVAAWRAGGPPVVGIRRDPVVTRAAAAASKRGTAETTVRSSTKNVSFVILKIIGQVSQPS